MLAVRQSFWSFSVWRVRYQQQTALYAELDTRLSISTLQHLDHRGRLCRQSRHPSVLPIPFNQPLIASPTNVVNGQTSSYGGTTPLFLDSEPVFTNEFSGNAPIRVPYPGYDMNAVSYKAEGISNFD